MFFNAPIASNAYKDYDIFELDGISESCDQSLQNSLKSLPGNIKRYLIEAKRRGMKLTFKKESLEEAQQAQFSGYIPFGVPILSASSDTIFTISDHCPLYNRNLTHEIGHIIHAIIRADYPSLAQEWSRLWQDIYEKNVSPSNPFDTPCPLNDCAFIGWKDMENEYEGFAQLILLSTEDYQEIWKNNKNPDFLRKLDFLNKF